MGNEFSEFQYTHTNENNNDNVSTTCMITDLVRELNSNTRTLSYDIIYNHSILSSVEANWGNFYVHLPGYVNTEDHVTYRRLRVNLHGLMIAVTAFGDNILKRLYLLNSIPFSDGRILTVEQLDLLQSTMRAEDNVVSEEVNDLFTDFWEIRSHLNDIGDKFIHSLQSDEKLTDLSIITIDYDPSDQGPYYKNIFIPTTFKQYLETVVRLFHVILDLKESIDVFEKDYNVEAFDNIPIHIEGGLKNAQYELRQSGRRVASDWDELHIRLKESFY